jgi:hypothetical protein
MKKKKTQKEPFTTYHRKADTGGWFNFPYRSLAFCIGQVKGGTADDNMLDYFVRQYEGRVREQQKKAISEFWQDVRRALEKGLLSDEEMEILHKAKYDDIKAIQYLVKANPNVVKLPFIHNAMIQILHKQKYSGEGTLDAKDAWQNFLHQRPKGKKMYSRESLRGLIEKGKQEGSELADICEWIGVSEDYLKKKTAIKGRKGRPKKKSK